MRCPNCEHDYDLPLDKNKCINCGYVFILPYDAVDDYLLQKQIAQVSANNTRYFTQHQLYAACYQKYSWLSLIGAWAKILVSFFVVVFVVSALVHWSFMLGLVAVVAYIFFSDKEKEPLMCDATPKVFEKALRKWIQQRHINAPKGTQLGPLKLIDNPTLDIDKKEPLHEVEVIVVTDQNLYVDLLVKNGYDVQYKALIVSKKLYPKHLKPRLKQLLEEKPNLPLFFIHDATSEGAHTMEQFKNISELAIAGHPCIDLGLTPQHFKALKSLKQLQKNKEVQQVSLDYLQHQDFTTIFNQYIVGYAR